MLFRPIIIITIAVFLQSCSNEELTGKVNGSNITRLQFDNYLELKNIPNDNAKRTEGVLKDYMQREAIASTIQKIETFDSKLIDAEVNEFKKQVLISRYFESYLSKKVSDEAIRNYYNTHPEEFQRERIKVAHLLIRTREKMSDIERQATLTRAQEAYSKARAGLSFADVAKQYSEDTVSAKQGGELGWLARGAVDPTFSTKLFDSNMAAGDISEPFQTPFGFHVVKIIENAEISKTPFEKVKGNIRYRLRQQAKQAEMARLTSVSNISYQ
jgi:peptidyl-prolyl cis-trans isomerase C